MSSSSLRYPSIAYITANRGVPTGKRLPDAGTQVGVRGPSTMSLAVAVNVTTLPPRVFASATMLASWSITRSSCVCNGYCKCHRVTGLP